MVDGIGYMSIKILISRVLSMTLVYYEQNCANTVSHDEWIFMLLLERDV